MNNLKLLLLGSEDMKANLKVKLKTARQHRMLSQERLSKAAGVSRTTISHLENDPEAVTTTQTLKKLAHALGINMKDFFAD